MNPPDADRLLEVLLAGTPARIVDVASGGAPEVIAEIDATREALASIALALPPVEPSASLRDRLAAAIAAEPRAERRRALVVVDMQRDHLTPGRALEIPRAREIVPALQARLAQSRRAGEPVIYLCDQHGPGDPEFDVWGQHNLEGTDGPEIWPDLAPEPGDIIVTHRSFSGFFETELEDVLRRLAVDTLVVTGCVTEVHVQATAVDALMRGFQVELPPDCQAGNSPIGEQVILATLSVLRPLGPAPR